MSVLSLPGNPPNLKRFASPGIRAIVVAIMLRAILDHSRDALGVSKRGTHVLVNRAYLDMFGYASAEELIGTSVVHLIAPESRDALIAIIEARANGEPAPTDYELIALRKDGTKFEMEVRVSQYELEGENYTLVILRDITERKQAEAALREAEERFRQLGEAAFEGIAITEKGHVVNGNSRLCQMLGYEISEMIGRPVSDFIAPESRELVLEMVRTNHEQPYEHAVLRKDGSTLPVEAHGRMITWKGQPLRVTALRDITERKRTEEHLFRAQRLESLGTLAGGIAHDFNNMLGGFFGYLELIQRSQDRKEAENYARKAMAGLERARNLTGQLLTFARGGIPAKIPVDLNNLVAETIEFVLAGWDGTVDFQAGKDLPPTEADPNHMKQVLENLLINARQAMQGRGRILLSTALHPPSQIRLTVKDEGVGISPEDLPRIFDPFFSTRAKGTGLGLAMVHSIVTKHGGSIQVTSAPGAGTAFMVDLPVSNNPIPSKTGTEAETTTRRAYRVLVMDDEPHIREISVKLLEVLGHKVETAKHGAEAVDAYARQKAAGEPFDLVILDLTVTGGMGGQETMSMLRDIDPAVRAIVSSGYSEDPIVAHPEQFGVVGSLLKPWSLKELEQVLQKAFG